MATRRGFLLGSLATACATPPEAPRAVLGGVRRLSPALDALIAPDAVVEEIGTGFQWAEGPLWIRNEGYLLFTDVPGNAMYAWRRGEGVKEFLRPSGFAGADASHLREGGANGLARDAAGAVVMCDTGNRNLSRLDLRTKRKTVIAERYDGKRFNSPNDLAIARSGSIYFTDPPYGLAGMSDSPLRETSFHGVYRLSPDGAVTLIEDGLSFPNGIALSPDESVLYIACSDAEAPLIKAFAMGKDGMPTGSRTFFDAKPLQGPAAPGNPDGMAIDTDGNLFATGPGGVMVIDPRGELLGVISASRAIANCAFGEDGRTLFVTAHDKLGRIRTRTRGA